MIARAGCSVLRDAIVTAILTASAIAVSGSPAGAQGYPEAANGSSVIVNYGALAPAYGSPVYAAPVYGTPSRYIAAAPRAIYSPYAVSPYAVSPYAVAPYVPPVPNAYRYGPTVAGFSPYGQATAAPFGSYAEKVVLKKPGAKKKKKKSSTQTAFAAPVPAQPASTPTATDTEAQTAAAVAAAEPAPLAPAAEPVAPAEPEAMPNSVPSPVPTTPADATATPTPPAPEPTPDAAATASAAGAVAPATDQQAAVTPEVPAAEAPAAETPAEPAADAGGSAALPAGGVRIAFDGDADELPEGATASLDAIAQKMLADESMRVQVMAYASGTPETENKARRKSLARGLAVRSYLIKAGVRSTRIDVRALGSKTEGAPADRVDVVPAAS